MGTILTSTVMAATFFGFGVFIGSIRTRDLVLTAVLAGVWLVGTAWLRRQEKETPQVAQRLRALISAGADSDTRGHWSIRLHRSAISYALAATWLAFGLFLTGNAFVTSAFVAVGLASFAEAMLSKLELNIVAARDKWLLTGSWSLGGLRLWHAEVVGSTMECNVRVVDDPDSGRPVGSTLVAREMGAEKETPLFPADTALAWWSPQPSDELLAAIAPLLTRTRPPL